MPSVPNTPPTLLAPKTSPDIWAAIENGQTYKSLTGDGGVGTFGGSQDHTAILTSEAGHLKQYSFCPVRFERTIKLPEDCVFVIGVSGVVADKTGSAKG